MIDRAEKLWRAGRQRLSRRWWLVRVFGLRMPASGGGEAGLLLIQIEGLGRRQLESAINKQHMPLLKILLERERYRLHSLEGGGTYNQVCTGGAAGSDDCTMSSGGGLSSAGLRPWMWPLIGLLYMPELFRACLRAGWEQAVAWWNILRAMRWRAHPLEELQQAAGRVAAGVVFRELAVIAASLDMMRGVPMIQVNFFGDAEQPHNGSPDGRYANWSLRGIDKAIQRIWKAASTSTCRDYQLWIYSEHRQERATANQELNGFALLPAYAPLDDPGKGGGRALDLWKGVFRFPHSAQSCSRFQHREQRANKAANVLRVMTYNIHSCIGMDGRVSTQRLAQVIATAEPDLIALQEVDCGRRRSGYHDQARRIAELLNMHCAFHCTFQVAEEKYGHAVLSRFPIRVIRGAGLPTQLPKIVEPRGALWVEMEFAGQLVQIVNTHLGLSAGERLRQIEALLGSEWLGKAGCQTPLILCGDLNAGPRSRIYRLLSSQFQDAQTASASTSPQSTFFSRWPCRRIDHIFLGGDWNVERTFVLRTELARKASDHLPLVADLQLSPQGPPSQPRMGTDQSNGINSAPPPVP